MLYADRRRAESFGLDAQRYDRSRPRYPDALIDAVLGSSPKETMVLDVGCGTGIAARQMSERGAAVLGVEPDRRMADLAAQRGTVVEIGTFESWEPGGRRFDRVTAGQSWHWINPAKGTRKAAAVLRPAGRLCVFWNVAEMPADLDSQLSEVYRRLAPRVDDYSVLLGRSPDQSEYAKGRFADQIEGIARCAELGAPAAERFLDTRTYSSEQWLDQLGTHSDHAVMEAPTRDLLLEAIRQVIDGLGGSFEMTYHAWLVSATRL
ncbi:MAG: class I SAM-dependent methyltransferase [Acidimicrobiales bacterium]